MSLDRGAIDGLIARVAAASFALGPERAAKMADFVARVDRTNERLDLTAARTPEELVDLLLADALVLAARIPDGARVVDVGSGAGAPGLPLAIARPDLRVTLVEPMQKRVSFLRTTAAAVLGADAMPRVVRARGEEVAAGGERFDAAISRATLPPAEWLALGARLAPDVWVLLAKAEPPASEEHATADDVAYTWPLTGAARRAVLFRRRISPTG